MATARRRTPSSMQTAALTTAALLLANSVPSVALPTPRPRHAGGLDLTHATVHDAEYLRQLPEDVRSLLVPHRPATALPDAFASLRAASASAGATGAARRSLLEAEDIEAAIADTSGAVEPPPVESPLATPDSLPSEAIAQAEPTDEAEVAAALPSGDPQPLESLCDSYTNGTATPFSCDLGRFELNVSTPFVAHITFETPLEPAGGQGGLDYIVTLRPIFGDPDMHIDRTDSGGSRGVWHTRPAGVDRVRFHAEDLTVYTTFDVRILMATLATQYELSIEGFVANATIAADDLQAVRSVAQACCAAGECIGSWEGLALEASNATATNETVVALCRDDNVHCSSTGQIVQLALEGSAGNNFTCTIADLAPLGTLQFLEHLTIDQTFISGNIGALLVALEDTQLHFLDIRNSPLISGSVPSECTATSVLPNLEHFGLIDIPVEGLLPDCLWSIDSVVIVATSIGGPLPQPTADSQTFYISVVGSADATANSRISGTDIDLSPAALLHSLSLAIVNMDGTLTLPTNIIDVYVAGVPTLTAIAADSAPELRLLQVLLINHSGPLPAFLASASNLLVLSWMGAGLTALPDDITWPVMQELYFSVNPLEDIAVLQPLMQLPELAVLFATSCNLTGSLNPIAEGVAQRRAGDASRLVVLSLADNQITGEMPTGLQALGVWQTHPEGVSAVNTLDVRGNSLEGDVPEELTDTSSMPPDLIVQILIAGNVDLACPASPLDAVIQVVCDDPLFPSAGESIDGSSREIDAISEDGGGGDSDDRVALSAGLISAAVVVVLAAIAIAVVARRRAQRRKREEQTATFEDSVFTADQQLASLPDM